MEQYRRVLAPFAQIGDRPAFASRAGCLFDHGETVESPERERKFLQVFASILALLIAAVLAVAGIEAGIHPDWPPYRYLLILAALSASSFELYFHLNFRIPVGRRTLCCKKRKDASLACLESDFCTRGRTTPVVSSGHPDSSAAAAWPRSAR